MQPEVREPHKLLRGVIEAGADIRQRIFRTHMFEVSSAFLYNTGGRSCVGVLNQKDHFHCLERHFF